MLMGAILNNTNLSGASLVRTDLNYASLARANLSGANLSEADLNEAKLSRANLIGANLSGADLRTAILIDSNFSNADLSGCRIHGVSAGGLKLEKTQQQNLVITREDEPAITVDNIEVAQSIYLLLHNQKVRDVIKGGADKACRWCSQRVSPRFLRRTILIGFARSVTDRHRNRIGLPPDCSPGSCPLRSSGTCR